MDYFKKNKRNILFVIFYLSVTLSGINAYLLAKDGLNLKEPLFLQLASLIGVLLTAFACFYELYFGKADMNR